jgi:orotate phosphoribosyltransferase
MNMECNSPYLKDILDNVRLKKIISHLTKIIKRKVGLDNFDAIMYRGMSGAGVATTIGYLLNKPLIMVRKETNNCHSHALIEGAIKANRVIIIDDCISTGNTLATMVRDFFQYCKKEEYETSLKVVAVLLYNDYADYRISQTENIDFSSKFCGVICSGISSDIKYRQALEAMSDATFYNFRLELCSTLPERKYKTILSYNLTLDDLK